MRRPVLSILILLLTAGYGAAAAVFPLSPETPLFDRPDLTAPAVRPAVRAAVPAEPAGEWPLIDSHLVRYLPLVRLELGGRTFYTSPSISVRRTADGAFRPEVAAAAVRGHRLWSMALRLALAGFAGWVAVRRFRGREIPDWSWPALAVLLRSALLAAVIAGSGGLYLFSSDEPDFFVTALDLTQGAIARFWPRSLGTGVWYWPFAAVLHAEDVHGLLREFSWFSGFVLAPLCLWLGFLIARKLAGVRVAAAVTLGFAVLPMFFFHYEVPDAGIVKSLFMLPDSELGFHYYKSLIWGGFNAMSDLPALLLLLAALAAALLLPDRRWLPPAVAALLAAACLLRVNAIFFAPLPAAAVWFRRRTHWSRRSEPWIELALAGAAFLLVFAPQLAMNARQLGSPFTFPYIRYEHTADGFRFAMLPFNIPLLFQANWPFYAAGLAGLAMVRERQIRLMLTLWIVPMTVFFLGYTHSCDDTTRFLFPVFGGLMLAAAIGFRDAFAGVPERSARIAVALLAVALLGTAPTDWRLAPQPWAMPFAATAALTALTAAALVRLVWKFRRTPAAAGGLALFALLFFSGSGWAAAGLTVLLSLRATGDLVREFRGVQSDSV